MAVTPDVIRTITIRMRTENADKVLRELGQADKSFKVLAGDADVLAKATERLDHSTLSAAASYDRMMRSLDPAHKAQREMERSTRAADRALAQGAITAEQHARALGLLKARHDTAVAGTQQLAKGLSNTGYAAGQLTFQLNDIFTGLLTGQSPFMVATQQAGQLSQILGASGGGLRGAASLVGTAFLSMLNPINLTIAGLGVAATAAAWFFSSSSDGADEATEALKRHEELIGRIKDAYGDAAKGLKAYGDESKSVLNFQFARSQEELRFLARTQTGEALNATRASGIGPGRSAASVLAPQFAPFSAEIAALGRAPGDPAALRRFREEIVRIANTQPLNAELQKAAKELLDLTEAAAKTASGIRSAVDDLTNGTAAMVDRLVAAGANMERMNGILADRIVSGQRAPSGMREPVNPGRNEAAFAFPGGPPLPREKPNLLDFDPDATGEKPTKAIDTFAELLTMTDRRIKQLEMERNALGMTDEAAARYRAEQELILQAEAKGITLSPQETEQLKARADAMANLQKQTEDMKDAQERSAEAMKNLGSAAEDVFMAFVRGGDEAKQAIIKLAAEMLRAALIGEGPFGGLFKKGGLLGGGGGSGGSGSGGDSGASVAGRTIDEAANNLPAGSEVVARAANDNVAGGVDAQTWNFWASKGLKPHQIAGIMGNIGAESGFNPSAVGDGGAAYGLYQHHGNRRAGIPNFLGNPTAQNELAWREMQGPESGVWSRLLASKDVAGATAAFTGFERPQGWSPENPMGSHNWTGRLAGADAALAKFGTTVKGTDEGLGTLGKGFLNFGEALGSGEGGGGAGAVGGILSMILGLVGGGFAKGGVSHRPAIFGEAGPEAAVPLPDGRSIPVRLHGGGGGGNTFSTTVNIGSANNDTVAELQAVLKRRDKDQRRQAAEAERSNWRRAI